MNSIQIYCLEQIMKDDSFIKLTNLTQKTMLSKYEKSLNSVDLLKMLNQKQITLMNG